MQGLYGLGTSTWVSRSLEGASARLGALAGPRVPCCATRLPLPARATKRSASASSRAPPPPPLALRRRAANATVQDRVASGELQAERDEGKKE